MPAWMNAFTTVSPDLRIETGPPIAFGSAARTASANLRSVVVVVGIALRQRLDAHAGRPWFSSCSPVPAAASSALTGPACIVFLSWSSTILSGVTKMFCALSRVAWSHSASFDSASASRRDATAPGPLPSPAALRRLVDRTLQRLDILLIGRRGIDRIGIERRVRAPSRALRDQLQLRRLIFGHEAVERHHAQHFRQLFQLRLDLLRFGFRMWSAR